MRHPRLATSALLAVVSLFVAACGGGGGGGGGAGSGDFSASTVGLVGGEITCFAAGSGATVYAGTSSQGVFRSDDRGATWTAARSGLPDAVVVPLGGLAAVRALAVDPSNPAIVYAGLLRGGVYRSSDSGPRGPRSTTASTPTSSGSPSIR
jgi:hypothetical protein